MKDLSVTLRSTGNGEATRTDPGATEREHLEGLREVPVTPTLRGAWPITFVGYWQDGDQDDPDLDGPWETFTVMVRGEEVGEMRELLPADLPALMAALGSTRETMQPFGSGVVSERWSTPWQTVTDE